MTDEPPEPDLYALFAKTLAEYLLLPPAPTQPSAAAPQLSLRLTMPASRVFSSHQKETHMTDATPTPDFNALFARATAEYHARCERRAACRPANKTALFDALAKAGITTVTVTFDGAGDSGQIDAIRASTGSADVPLPEATIKFVQRGQDGASRIDRCLDVKDAIEELVYDALEEAHGSWCNDDGAYGEFIFDVAKRTISLDYNERYTLTDHYHHEF